MSDSIFESFPHRELEHLRQDLSIKQAETEQSYYERMVEFWKDRFQKQGKIYCLPHHYYGDLDHVLLVKNELDKPSKFSNLLILNLGKMQAAVLADSKHSTSAGIPEGLKTDYPELNSNKPYKLDVYGNNQEYLLEHSLNASAILTATAQSTDIGVVLTCNPFETERYDASCLLVHIFGEGEHCRIGYATTRLLSERGEVKRDLETLMDTAKAIKSLNSPEVDIIPGMRPPLTAQIYMPHHIAFGEIGKTIRDKVNPVVMD